MSSDWSPMVSVLRADHTAHLDRGVPDPHCLWCDIWRDSLTQALGEARS